MKLFLLVSVVVIASGVLSWCIEVFELGRKEKKINDETCMRNYRKRFKI